MKKQNVHVFLSIPVLMGVIAAFSGCAAMPERHDPFADLNISKTGNYKDLTVALTLSSNTKDAIHYMDKKKAEASFAAGFDTDAVFRQMKERLVGNFKQVVKIDRLEDVKATTADLIVVLDVFADIGYVSFSKTKVDMSGIFLTLDGKQIDVVHGVGEKMIPFPNLSRMVSEATTEAQDNFDAALLRSKKLAEFSKAKESRTTAVAIKTPAQPDVHIPVSDVDTITGAMVKPNKHAYAIVIGIEQYREKLPRADFADRDAKLVGEYLTKVMGYPEENVIVRLNERATRTDLVKYFEEWLKNNVEPGGSVFVYYSGHGAPNTKTGEAYLVPYDGDPSFVDSTAYPVKQMYAALDKLPAKDVTVVLDSCFSGAGGRSVLAKGARPMGLSIENQVLATGKTVVLAASGGDQISNSFEEKGHGLLTYFFLKGLQGDGDANKDGTIEMTELYDYVKPNVQRIARKQYNNEQTPQLLASPDVLKKGGGRLVERAHQ